MITFKRRTYSMHSIRFAYAALPVLLLVLFVFLTPQAHGRNHCRYKSKPQWKYDDYNLLIAPVLLEDVLSPNFDPNDIEPVHPVAGEAFTVFVAIVDDRNRVIDVDGDFQFKWSSHNYIKPDKPDNREKLVDDDGWFDITNGTAIIANIRYDEVGVIMLSGMARFRTAKNNGNGKGKGKWKKDDDDDDDDDDKGKTTVIQSYSEPFLMQPYDFRITAIPSAVDDEGNMYAGDSFSLIITPVNGRGDTLENFYQTLSNGTQITLTSRVTEPEYATVHTIYDSQNNAVDSVSAYSFRDGSATLRDLHFDDAGLLEVQLLITNYFGLTVTSGAVQVGRFIPKTIAMEIEQPPVSGGLDAQYNYAGQPFFATVAIQALNNRTPPAVTHNYQESQSGVFELALQPSDRSLGTLVYDASQNVMMAGEKLIAVTASLPFQSTLNPLDLQLQYSYENDGDDLVFSKLGPESEFRCGRIRFRHNRGMVGDYLEIQPEIEYYADSLWQVNEEEDSLILSTKDMEIKETNSGGSILGSERQFYGGRIRGGTEPFEVSMQSILNPVEFSIQLRSHSTLSFLENVSEPWWVVPEDSYTPKRNRVFVYETSN